MTSLVLGVAGGMIGNMLAPGIGGSIGFLVGSLLGNLIDPPKIEGPRRTDLKLQRSEYGTMFPFLWGTGRVAGNIIDQTDLEEHKETSGGKGGPEVTTYTYSASFVVALAAAKRFGEPAILGVLRIWADGRLIWDVDDGTDMPCTVYAGSEDQEPDPTFEAINGVGQQPAYRGLAYAVFADMMLTDYGDRIPLLEFEICTELGAYPWRVHSTQLGSSTYGLWGVTYDSDEGIVTSWSFTTTAGGRYDEFQHDLDGNLVDSYWAYLDTYAGSLAVCLNLPVSASWTGWFYKENYVVSFTANPHGGPVSGSAGMGVYKSNYIYAIGNNPTTGNVGIGKWPATDGVISAETGTAVGAVDLGYANNQTSLFRMGTTNEDAIYITDAYNSPFTLKEYDLDLNFVREWDLDAEHAISNIVNGRAFTVYRQPVTDNLIFAVDRGNVGFKEMFCFVLNDDLTLTQVDGIGTDPAGGSAMGPVIELGGTGYVTVADGLANLNPPPIPVPLSTIVADLSSMTSLSSEGSPETDSYDVSELTDEVRWYAVSTQTTVRNAIDPLRRGFFFDAVESDDMVKFRKRGATDSVVTIDDDDLIAREYGADSGDPLITTRKREQGMPRTVTLKYIDVNMDYQTGAQNSPRLTTLSDSDVTLDLPIGFTADEALQKCWSLQVAEWIERESFEWATTRKYAWVEPCDVVTVRGRVVRVTNRQETPKGVITWTGVLHRPSVYTQSQTAGSSVGFVAQSGGTQSVSTEAVLLDIPVLTMDAAPFGFYAAMGPARAGRWPGATLYKSVDGGSTYEAVASSNVASVIGETGSSDDIGSPSYGSPTVGGALSAYAGGDVVEEASILVTLTDADAELVSINATGLTNGANLCAVSRGTGGSPATTQWELLQFRDATLIAERTYVLSGFLRGRRGTGTSGHAAGDVFVLLPVSNVDAPQEDLNRTLLYKAVTFGRTLADTSPISFINTGEGAGEYFETVAGQLPIIPNPQTGTTYTLQATDNLKLITLNNASPVTLTLPATLPAGWACFVENIGAGTATLNAGSATIDEGGSTLDLETDQGVLIAWDGDEWYTMRGISGTSTGSGAPTTAKYILREQDAALPNAFELRAGVGITLQEDAGSPGSLLTIHSATADYPYYVAGPASGLSKARALVAGTGITFTDGGGSPPTTTTVAVSASVAAKIIQFACSDETSELIAGTRKIALRAPYAMTITAVRASLSSVSAGSPNGGGITVDINVNGTSILSTKLTIDANELTSVTAATAAVISSSALADDDEISVDIDSVGSGAAGLKVALIGS